MCVVYRYKECDDEVNDVGENNVEYDMGFVKGSENAFMIEVRNSFQKMVGEIFMLLIAIIYVSVYNLIGLHHVLNILVCVFLF